MMRRLSVIGGMVIASTMVVAAGQTGSKTSTVGVRSAAEQRALLDQYCVSCHNEKQKSAGLALDKADLARVGENAELWEKVVHKVRAGMQPPSGRPRPDAATLEAFVAWLENELDRNAALRLPPPGLHRVNRVEYSNAIRDLLALDIDASKFLPPDDS